MQRAIVTGGAGFVGSNLVRTLQQTHPQAQILIIDDMRLGTFANLVGSDENDFVYRGQILARSLSDVDLPGLLERFRPDAIFHLASITDTTVADQARMIRDNVEPFEILLNEAVARNIALAWASSAATYGLDANQAAQAKRPFAISDAGRPANVYGFSKWVMENLHRQVQAAHPQAHIVGLRYFNVFGPREQNKGRMASMVYQLAQQMLQGHRPRIFTDGEQARDQVYVQDVVDATLAAGSPGAQSGIYNVGSGQTLSFNQIVAGLNEALGTQLEPDYIDNPYAFYQNYTCADLTKTRQGLGWSPRFDPRTAVVDYARWIARYQRK